MVCCSSNSLSVLALTTALSGITPMLHKMMRRNPKGGSVSSFLGADRHLRVAFFILL